MERETSQGVGSIGLFLDVQPSTTVRISISDGVFALGSGIGINFDRLVGVTSFSATDTMLTIVVGSAHYVATLSLGAVATSESSDPILTFTQNFAPSNPCSDIEWTTPDGPCAGAVTAEVTLLEFGPPPAS